jgi:Zn finger protein HypA/HybF involved in hydrogenase expression
MPSGEPIWTDCKCIICGYKWSEFFPDGYEFSDKAIAIECPECKKNDNISTGEVIRNANARFLNEDE